MRNAPTFPKIRSNIIDTLVYALLPKSLEVNILEELLVLPDLARKRGHVSSHPSIAIKVTRIFRRRTSFGVFKGLCLIRWYGHILCPFGAIGGLVKELDVAIVGLVPTSWLLRWPIYVVDLALSTVWEY